MKILKNLLGENAKIHGDSIFLESGSNDDGYWVKLPDSTQICIIPVRSLSKSTNFYLAGGGIFPLPFKDSNVVVTPIIVEDSTTPVGRLVQRAVSETGFNLWYQNVTGPFTGGSYMLKFRAIAIGRGK